MVGAEGAEVAHTRKCDPILPSFDPPPPPSIPPIPYPPLCSCFARCCSEPFRHNRCHNRFAYRHPCPSERGHKTEGARTIWLTSTKGKHCLNCDDRQRRPVPIGQHPRGGRGCKRAEVRCSLAGLVGQGPQEQTPNPTLASELLKNAGEGWMYVCWQ